MVAGGCRRRGAKKGQLDEFSLGFDDGFGGFRVWGCPPIPHHHPFLDGIFLEINHLCWGTPWLALGMLGVDSAYVGSSWVFYCAAWPSVAEPHGPMGNARLEMMLEERWTVDLQILVGGNWLP